jgi:hypothetical protein
VAFEIDLGVVFLVDKVGHCFEFVVSLVLPQYLLPLPHFFMHGHCVKFLVVAFFWFMP